MRDASIEDEFKRIMGLPRSENKDRVHWLKDNLEMDSLLDIGSGLGVFPYSLKHDFGSITCIEPCVEAAMFIRDSLGISCFIGMYAPETIDYPETTVTSLVHVLEHMPDPMKTLENIKSPNLFIEVPDAVEFETLPKDHDEFNSTHLWFFNVSTLDRLCRDAGWQPYKIERVHYPERNLSRIRLLAQNAIN